MGFGLTVFQYFVHDATLLLHGSFPEKALQYRSQELQANLITGQFLFLFISVL